MSSDSEGSDKFSLDHQAVRIEHVQLASQNGGGKVLSSSSSPCSSSSPSSSPSSSSPPCSPSSSYPFSSPSTPRPSSSSYPFSSPTSPSSPSSPHPSSPYPSTSSHYTKKASNLKSTSLFGFSVGSLNNGNNYNIDNNADKDRNNDDSDDFLSLEGGTGPRSEINSSDLLSSKSKSRFFSSHMVF